MFKHKTLIITGGTGSLGNAVLAGGVKNMIVLSTDKAVYPINAMGCRLRRLPFP